MLSGEVHYRMLTGEEAMKCLKIFTKIFTGDMPRLYRTASPKFVSDHLLLKPIIKLFQDILKTAGRTFSKKGCFEEKPKSGRFRAILMTGSGLYGLEFSDHPAYALALLKHLLLW
jgi:hypothetical protein